MSDYLTIIGFALNGLISLTILITFVSTRRGEYKERIKHEIILENDIKETQRLVKDMIDQLKLHQGKLDLLTQDLGLLLQQHLANHGQDIRRGK